MKCAYISVFEGMKGVRYKRINKRQAAKEYAAGNTIYIAPCNMPPFGGVRIGDKTDFEKDRCGNEVQTRNADFDKLVNEFTYYNCINGETGRYPAYYLLDKPVTVWD